MLILIAAAVIPAVVLMVRIYALDRMEKEPLGLLAALLLLGLVSTALASLTEQLGDIWVRVGGARYNAWYDIAMICPFFRDFDPRKEQEVI